MPKGSYPIYSRPIGSFPGFWQQVEDSILQGIQAVNGVLSGTINAINGVVATSINKINGAGE